MDDVEVPDDFDVWMSREEKLRFEKLNAGATRRRQALLSSHWLARQLLARRLGGDARDWQMTYAKSGRPSILNANATDVEELHISIAHSKALVACAISDQRVGIDLEINDPSRDFRGLASLAFDAFEADELEAAESELQRVELFYEMWCAKEACLKASDQNLQVWDLQKIRVRRAGLEVAGSTSDSDQALIYRCVGDASSSQPFTCAVTGDSLQAGEIHWVGDALQLTARYFIA